MSRKGKALFQCSLYCLNCGEKGLPIWRSKGKRRGRGHRKVLYCPNCRETVNHLELETMEQVEQFKKDFAEGKYRAEAEESIRYVKEKHVK